MTSLARTIIIVSVMIAGGWAACINWALGWPLIVAYAMLFVLRWAPQRNITRLMLVLAVSQSLYSALVTLTPRMPFQFCLTMGLFFIAVCIISAIFYRSIKGHWIGVCGLSGFILITAGCAHFVINAMLGKPFDGSTWTPVAWAAVSFTAAYALVNETTTNDAAKKLTKALPVLIAIIITAHALQDQRLTYRLESESNPGAIAPIAFCKGYDTLGRRAAQMETKRLLASHNIGAAVRYMRQQWRHVDKTYFIPPYKEMVLTQYNLFFLSTCFGVQLSLNENETVIDGAVSGDPQAIYVLTSHNRLIAVTPKEMELLPVPLEYAKAIHASAYGVGVLCASQAVTVSNDLQIKTFAVDQANLAKDIALSQDGQRCFILLGTGQVDEYGREESSGWAFTQTRYKALWKEPDAAVALRLGNDDGVYVLTRNGGVHYHDSAVYNRELSPFWDPQRAAMRDFSLDAQSNQLLLMDDFGRVDFIDLNHIPTTERPVAAGWPSIPAQIEFDRANAVWSGSPNRAAIVVVPGADTALQFLSNGFIQAIALPQGARVSYRRGELKLYTHNLK